MRWVRPAYWGRASQWQEENAGKTRTVTVYESDGITVVGEFVIEG
ncbi:hypothetical protein [Nocardioides sp. AE5]|nr:hypothetical protein [Nocardioides sp. AE5]MDT0200455.1 hypothetical protein [Nocardioides sp. AE5]